MAAEQAYADFIRDPVRFLQDNIVVNLVGGNIDGPKDVYFCEIDDDRSYKSKYTIYPMANGISSFAIRVHFVQTRVGVPYLQAHDYDVPIIAQPPAAPPAAGVVDQVDLIITASLSGCSFVFTQLPPVQAVHLQPAGFGLPEFRGTDLQDIIEFRIASPFDTFRFTGNMTAPAVFGPKQYPYQQRANIFGVNSGWHGQWHFVAQRQNKMRTDANGVLDLR